MPMKKIFFISGWLLLFNSITIVVIGQSSETRLRDTSDVEQLLNKADELYFINPDSCLVLTMEALNLSRELHFTRGEVTALNKAGESLRFLGDFPASLKMQYDALQINRDMKDLRGEAISLSFIGFTYVEFGQYRQALDNLQLSGKLFAELSMKMMIAFNMSNTGNAYSLMNMPDSALYYQQNAYENYNRLTDPPPPLRSLILTRIGNAYFSLGKKDTALQYYHNGIFNSAKFNDKVNESKIQRKIAELYASVNQYDSSMFYARQAYTSAKKSVQRLEILEVSILLDKLFRNVQNKDSALFYKDIAMNMKDSLYGPEKIRQLQLLVVEEQGRQQKIKEEDLQLKNRLRYIFLLSALGVFLLLAFIQYRSNRQKQKANTLLQEQKAKIEKTLTELKATQQQLIQSEKMASLGELTAGIAHEIQNPLNFVNNFSEVNTELVDELKSELATGNMQSAIEILNDIKDNEEKITHHGKRADAIVKGMLQHSRSSSGIKEPTDVNALCDEYLRLSYHGLRAKDKSFNATMKTDFDENIGNINIVPQDIGRVVLNLINNAFYAVDEKKKQSGKDYEPTVNITTSAIQPPLGGRSVQIKVFDNGGGIPQKIIDKIFQPFFTTKPTGQGTGLGLSLSYDIVKAHGGELNVETKEARPDDPVGRGEGTEFIIKLPVK
jgi:signal transduction histidine kinase